jgi:hypothetical protein
MHQLPNAGKDVILQLEEQMMKMAGLQNFLQIIIIIDIKFRKES